MDQDKPDPPQSENAKGNTTPPSIPAPIPTRETTVLPQVLKSSVNEVTTTTFGAILEVSTSTDFVADTTLVLSQIRVPGIAELGVFYDQCCKGLAFDLLIGSSLQKILSSSRRERLVPHAWCSPTYTCCGCSPGHESVRTRVQYFPRLCTINVAQSK
jgi:hypothetical protein